MPADQNTGALAKFFAEVWTVAREGVDFPGIELQDEMVKHGLAEWRPATAEEADRHDVDEGSEIIALTDAGRAALAEAAKP